MTCSQHIEGAARNSERNKEDRFVKEEELFASDKLHKVLNEFLSASESNETEKHER